MDEILWLLRQVIRDLEAARRRTGSKKAREHIRRALAHVNRVHQHLTT